MINPNNFGEIFRLKIYDTQLYFERIGDNASLVFTPFPDKAVSFNDFKAAEIYCDWLRRSYQLNIGAIAR